MEITTNPENPEQNEALELWASGERDWCAPGGPEDAFDDSPERFSTDADSFERSALLDGLKIRVRSQRFRGGRLTAMLAGVTIDLRDAVLAPEGATIDLQSSLSGIDIRVPKDWDVECEVDSVFSGVGAERPSPRAAGGKPRLRLVGSVVAGGLHVR